MNISIVLVIIKNLVDKLKDEDFSSRLRNDCPGDKRIEKTRKIIKLFNIKNGEELRQLYLKSDVLLLACVFEKFKKVSINEFGINPVCCVSLPDYTWQCGLKCTGINLQTLRDKDMIFIIENVIRVGISSVMGSRYVKSGGNEKILYTDAIIL